MQSSQVSPVRVQLRAVSRRSTQPANTVVAHTLKASLVRRSSSHTWRQTSSQRNNSLAYHTQPLALKFASRAKFSAYIPRTTLSWTAASTSNMTTAAIPLKLAPLEGVEAAKRAAAYAAVDNHVRPEHVIIGIGSGSTVPYVVERIAQQGETVNAKRWFVPTGFQSKQLIVENGLKLGDVDSNPSIDVTIDGADEVDHDLNAIKGGGACQLREKVLAEAADSFIIVADYRKESEILGTSWTQGVPIEVAEFAWSKVQRQLVKMGSTAATLRMGKMKAGPVVTDNGNFVIDAVFPETIMRDPQDLLARIKLLTGVLEVGLFVHMCKAAYFGNKDGTITAKRPGGHVERGITFDVTRNPLAA